MKRFTFEADAVALDSQYDGVEKTGVWTDGVMLSSEHEKRWPAAMRLQRGKRYKITIKEVERKP